MRFRFFYISFLLFCSAFVLSTNLLAGINPDSLDITIVAVDTFLCPGEETSLSIDGSEADSFVWSTGEITESITVSPELSTTYSVTATQVGENLIVNGDFSQGAVAFTSDYDQGTGGPFGILSTEGTFDVSNSPNASHDNFADCGDNTTGTGNMLVVNGSTTANQNIWCQLVAIQPNTDYLFSAWLASAISENPAILQFSINGDLLGNPFNATLSTCNWQEFFETWNSENNVTAEICIVNQNTSQSGNDFALDDITLQPICVSDDEIEINVSDLSAAVEFVAPSCGNEPVSVSILIENGMAPYEQIWSTGETTTTVELPSAGSYTVTVSDATDCEVVLLVEIDAPSITSLSIDELVSTSCGLENGAISLSATAGIEPYEFSIDGGATFQSSGFFTNLPAGDYAIIVQDAVACSDEAIVNILNSVPLEASIIATPDTFLCTDFVALEVGDFETYVWSDGSDAAEIMVTEIGDFGVTVTDMDGCEAEASISIAECGEYAIPNVFTPNGDGENDLFGVFFSGNVEVQSMRVFNRWGTLVHDSPQKWDGTFKGEPHPSDVLIYEIVIETPEGIEQEKGQVTLLR